MTARGNHYEQVRLVCDVTKKEIAREWSDSTHGRKLLDGWDYVHLPSGPCPPGKHRVERRVFTPWARTP